jgi:Kef-type K+ transport system membrane component KefB
MISAGGFLVGVIMPHHKGFTTSMTEKLEDLVSVLFLPIYFTFSGLRTDLGLLNNGGIWGWAVCVIVVAFASKFFGCFAAAKLNGFTIRESAAVGSLMSCKGLVELIGASDCPPAELLLTGSA